MSEQTAGGATTELATATAGAEAQQPSDNVAMSPSFRMDEEMTALLMGFGAGLGIAFIFLIYVVLEAAKLL